MKTYIIKTKIIEKHLTIKEVAEITKLNEQTISNWINKKNLSNIDKFLKLIIFLDINIKDLY